jgi:biopolymer transport protein ExbD
MPCAHTLRALHRPLALWRLVLVAALMGCSEKPLPRTVEVSVSGAGEYRVEGKNVPQAELEYELKALQSGRPGSVKLRINADPQATFAATGLAIKAAQDAGIGEISFAASAPAK